MQILDMSMANYIFLSREIPLPLSALKIIKARYSFEEVIKFSVKNFKRFLLGFKQNFKIPIREIDKKVAAFAEKNNEETFSRIQRDLTNWEKNQIKCLSFFDPNFPSLIKNVEKPTPKLIFIKGQIKSEDNKAVAIIGTRRPTEYGKQMAKDIAKRLVELGFTIVSGFARGIDTIAMKSALDNGGRAIGVIASGILNLYPKENQYLVDKLVKNGALISEKFPNKNVDKRALQIRNRITSGLGLGNIFVEGTKISGTIWQYRFGKAQNRLAFAVEPIDYECEQAYIPKKIIDEGGVRISNIDDVDIVAEMLMEEYKKRMSMSIFSSSRNVSPETL